MPTGSGKKSLTGIFDQIKLSSSVIGALSSQADKISDLSDALVLALCNGQKVLTAGNGGSAAESLHLSEELIGRFRSNRRPLPAVCLAADCTALTCIANDFGYNEVFSRQVEALGVPGDMLVVFSSSGNSNNIVRAVDVALERKMVVACLLGKDGGELAGRGHHQIIVDSSQTERVQEAHQVLIHIFLDRIEEVFS